MKKLIFVFLLPCLTMVYGQNDNPYTFFGHVANVIKRPVEKRLDVRVIENSESGQPVKRIIIDTKEKLLYVLSESSDEIAVTPAGARLTIKHHRWSKASPWL